MQLLNPVGLWFLMSLPVIIALYLLKRRYQEQIVSSNYLWEVILKDIEANTPWQRLKKNWLMILQLIVASLLILAICRPLIPLAGGMDRHVIAVLDCSSSMLATDVKPTRFQEAQEQIQQAIDGLGPGELMTIISMGEQPDVLISASRDKTQLKNALKTAEPGLGSADLESAMAVASSIGEQKANSIIIIFSDGNTRPVEREISSTCPVEFRQIGEGNDNVGFITFAARQQPLGTALLARVRNYSDQEIAIDIELRVNEHLVDVKPVVLRPGETKEQIWTELGSIKGVITAAITRRDSFSLDNTAATVVEETGNPRVLLATKGNIYMEKVLLLFKGLETYKTSAEDYSPDGEEYGLYIYDGFIPPSLPHGNVLIINPPDKNHFIEVEGELGHAENLKADLNHHLMNYVNVEEWKIGRSKKISAPIWAKTLVEYGDNPLLLAGELDGRRIVVLPFDLHQSNIPLQTSFPIMMNNIINWLLPGMEPEIITGADNCLKFNPASDTKEIQVWLNNEKLDTIKPPFINEYQVGKPGVYKYIQISDDRQIEKQVAVNALNTLESDIEPGDLPWDKVYTGEAGSSRPGKQEIWNWLVWLALVFLVIEWEVYRREY